MRSRWFDKTEDTIHNKDKIAGFTGDYRWLSNFWPCTVFYGGIEYASTEAAYQASKTLDISLRETISTLDAKEAKSTGKSLMLREDWEQVKDTVMYDVCKDKFTRNKELKERLISTENKYLEETNWWGDTYWGVCRGIGENKLGLTLMCIRDEIRENKIS